MAYADSHSGTLARYGRLLNSTVLVLTISIVVLAIVLVLELALPLGGSLEAAFVPDGGMSLPQNGLLDQLEESPKGAVDLARLARRGLFKPATLLRARPIADKTLERIKSSLKLKCVVDMNQERVAYISIKGTGLRQCRVGDVVDDLFTVLNIAKGRVEVSIVDHKVVLKI